MIAAASKNEIQKLCQGIVASLQRSGLRAGRAIGDRLSAVTDDRPALTGSRWPTADRLSCRLVSDSRPCSHCLLCLLVPGRQRVPRVVTHDVGTSVFAHDAPLLVVITQRFDGAVQRG